MGFVEGLPAEQAEALLARGRRHSYTPGTVLFHEREVGESVILITCGHVKVTRSTGAGREVLLAIRGAGALLGELAALTGKPRAATATAVDGVETIELPNTEFARTLAADGDVALAVARLLAERLLGADARVIQFASQDSAGRVALRLTELARDHGSPDADGIRIGLPLTQEDLAGWTSCSIEAVAKALAVFRTMGWIETGRRSILVRDLPALEDRARL